MAEAAYAGTRGECQPNLRVSSRSRWTSISVRSRSSTTRPGIPCSGAPRRPAPPSLIIVLSDRARKTTPLDGEIRRQSQTVSGPPWRQRPVRIRFYEEKTMFVADKFQYG
jgi:hypothetical protein